MGHCPQCEKKLLTAAVIAKTALAAARRSCGLPKMKLGSYPHHRLDGGLAGVAVRAEAATKGLLADAEGQQLIEGSPGDVASLYLAFVKLGTYGTRQGA